VPQRWGLDFESRLSIVFLKYLDMGCKNGSGPVNIDPESGGER
jgi:hypothetical protein